MRDRPAANEAVSPVDRGMVLVAEDGNGEGSLKPTSSRRSLSRSENWRMAACVVVTLYRLHIAEGANVGPCRFRRG